MGSHGLSLALKTAWELPCPELTNAPQPQPIPEPLFLGTAVLLMLMGPLPQAQRFAEVNDIEFIFCLQAQWQPFGEKEQRGRQAQEADCVHGIPQLSHGSGVWWGFSKVLRNLGLDLSFPFCSYCSPKCAKSPLPDVIDGFDLGQHEG